VVGTTLVEVLVSLTFLAAVILAILTGVSQSNRRAGMAGRRNAVLTALQSRLAEIRSTADSASLVQGSSEFSIELPSSSDLVSAKQAVSLVAGYSDLYSVSLVATWYEDAKSQSLSLKSLVRAPNV